MIKQSATYNCVSKQIIVSCFSYLKITVMFKRDFLHLYFNVKFFQAHTTWKKEKAILVIIYFEMHIMVTIRWWFGGKFEENCRSFWLNIVKKKRQFSDWFLMFYWFFILIIFYIKIFLCRKLEERRRVMVINGKK